MTTQYQISQTAFAFRSTAHWPAERRLDLEEGADTDLMSDLMSSPGRELTTADTLPAMQMLGSVTVTVGLATCSVTVPVLVKKRRQLYLILFVSFDQLHNVAKQAENQNNTYVKCSMTQARRASRADPQDGELRGQIISAILG